MNSNSPNFNAAKNQQGSERKAASLLWHWNPLTIYKKGRRAKALFALALVCFFWGTTWIASKQAVRYVHPLQMAGIRQSLGGLCYVLFFLYRRAAWPRGKEWFTVVILSFLNFMLSNGLSTWGVKYISAGLGAIIGAIFPLWLVLIMLVGTATKMSGKTVAGLLLGFTGICVIFYEHLNDFLNPGFRLGIWLSLASTWSWALGTLYTKKQAAQFNPYFSLGLQMLISGITLYALSSAAGQSINIRQIPVPAWIAIGYLVVFGSVISFIAYLYALQNLPTEQASLYAYINPIVAVFFGWMLFSEVLTPFIVGGTLITLYGVYLVNKSVARLR